MLPKLVFILAGLLSSITVVSQQRIPVEPRNVPEHEKNDLAERLSNRSSEMGPSSSLIDPPKAADNNFVINEQEDLDTGCTTRAGRPSGSLRIRLAVTRVVSKTQNQLSEADVQRLTQNGVLGGAATLKLQTYDVDTPGEVDEVFFNGVKLGKLTGRSGKWIPQHFQVPLHLVKFATYQSGGTPTPGENLIEVKIDTLMDGGWCTAVDWAALSVKVMSPVVLIHGNGSNGEFFTRQGFATRLDALGVLTDKSIFLLPKYIDANAREIHRRLPGIAGSFGVDSVHVVTHSKGGLDFRGYLAAWHQTQSTFRVLSFTTLATPHNGSSLADILVNGSDYLKSNDIILGAVLTYFGPYQDSHKDLVTARVTSFNHANIPTLSRSYHANAQNKIIFNTVAADADKDGDKSLDASNPNELSELVDEACLGSSFPSACRPLNTLGAQAIYSLLLNTKSVKVTLSALGRPRIMYVPNIPPEDNDSLVGLSSAKGVNSFQNLVTNSDTLAGNPGGRNHASVADAEAANRVLQWLITADRGEFGDLR